MKRAFYLFGLLTILGFASCDTISKLPTNTTGGVFNLNGRWALTASNENSAQVGTVINVVPVIGTANVVSVAASNPYCYKEKDVAWRTITSSGSGGFTISALVGACSGSINYRDAAITVISNNEIRVMGKNASGGDLAQTWNRSTQ